jgi:hypothetical protein
VVGLEQGRPGDGLKIAALGGMGHSRHDLLKARIAAPPGDHYKSLVGGPDDFPANPRLPGKHAVAIPHRRLQRERKSIAEPKGAVGPSVSVVL